MTHGEVHDGTLPRVGVSSFTELYDYAKTIHYLKDYAVDVPGAKVKKLDRLHLDSSTFKGMRKAPLQVLQSLPVTVAESTLNSCTDIRTSEENQG